MALLRLVHNEGKQTLGNSTVQTSVSGLITESGKLHMLALPIFRSEPGVGFQPPNGVRVVKPLCKQAYQCRVDIVDGMPQCSDFLDDCSGFGVVPRLRGIDDGVAPVTLVIVVYFTIAHSTPL